MRPLPSTEKQDKPRRPVGRPRSDNPREVECSFYLTKEDAAWFEGFARALKFRNRSHLMTAVAERLKEGGFAPAAFLKLGFMFSKRLDALGTRSKNAGYFNPFKGLFPLPDPEDPSPEELEEFLHKIESQLTQK